MNKKGFTLIEVLAVITLIGIIATMLSANIINYLDESDKYEKETLNNIYVTAAEVYLNKKENKEFKEECKKNGCTITSDTLLKKELLEIEDVKNPKIILINYKNKNFIYEVKDD